MFPALRVALTGRPVRAADSLACGLSSTTVRKSAVLYKTMRYVEKSRYVGVRRALKQPSLVEQRYSNRVQKLTIANLVYYTLSKYQQVARSAIAERPRSRVG